MGGAGAGETVAAEETREAELGAADSVLSAAESFPGSTPNSLVVCSALLCGAVGVVLRWFFVVLRAVFASGFLASWVAALALGVSIGSGVPGALSAALSFVWAARWCAGCGGGAPSGRAGRTAAAPQIKVAAATPQAPSARPPPL
ncbi:MAG: hypothetical protein ACRDLL_17430, partial [Solirubrobacterales bacterium]